MSIASRVSCFRVACLISFFPCALLLKFPKAGLECISCHVCTFLSRRLSTELRVPCECPFVSFKFTLNTHEHIFPRAHISVNRARSVTDVSRSHDCRLDSGFRSSGSSSHMRNLTSLFRVSATRCASSGVSAAKLATLHEPGCSVKGASERLLIRGGVMSLQRSWRP